MPSQVFGTIIAVCVGLFILYLVIYTAVKDGINKSVIGQQFDRKHEMKTEKSFLKNDLDQDA